MAQLCNYPGGRKAIQWAAPDGKRKTLRLGKISKNNAEIFRHRVELILSSQVMGLALDPDTSAWAARVQEPIRSRMIRCGLFIGEAKPRKNSMTFIDYVNAYIEKRSSAVKPATRIVWKTASDAFAKTIPPGMSLQQLHAGHAQDWIDAMRTAKLKPTTIHKRLSFVKQFLDHAVDSRLIPSNPFESVKVVRPREKTNVEVTRDQIAALLAVLDPTWQAIVALCRFGGLRCPSEVLSLRWEHIDLESNVMRIPEPKNEHHEGRGMRVCPLFADLRPYLEKLPRGEYVIDKPEYRARAMKATGWANANLRTYLLNKMEEHGLAPWPRLFHSMRASRQTELERQFGITAACAWIGNTPQVARASYLLVTSDEWQKATGKSDVKTGVPRPHATDRDSPTKRKKPGKT